jgi:hypothetical protein
LAGAALSLKVWNYIPFRLIPRYPKYIEALGMFEIIANMAFVVKRVMKCLLML